MKETLSDPRFSEPAVLFVEQVCQETLTEKRAFSQETLTRTLLIAQTISHLQGIGLGKTAGLLFASFLITASFAVALPTVQAASRTLVVPDHYYTIQAAIDSASDGDTVFVKKGVYTFSWDNYGIQIGKSISLIGENSQYTTLKQTEYGYPRSVIDVSADNVTISGFTITGTQTGIILENNSDFGSHQPSGCSIIGNNIAHNGFCGILTYSYSKNNVISGNVITENGQGVSLSSSDSIISNNNITGNVGSSITIDNCQNVTVNQNIISSNLGGGVNLAWIGPFYVYGNNITDNKGSGVGFGNNCSLSLVHNNNIFRNTVGVSVGRSFNESFVGVGNKVFYNNFVDNGKSVRVDVSGLTDVVSWDNGVGNYWSDYTGWGTYVIDKHNIDHYPLLHQIDVSNVPPSSSPEPPSSFPILLVVAVFVAVMAVIAVAALVYWKKRKRQD